MASAEALSLLSSPAASSRFTAFQLSVFRACACIPRGRVTTYGLLGASIGRPGSAQAVGNALHVNPFAPTIPCHRVVPASLTLGGFEGSCGGPSGAKKLRLLEEEGVRFKLGKVEGGKQVLWTFEEAAAGGGAAVKKAPVAAAAAAAVPDAAGSAAAGKKRKRV
jgi:methylated-DNA-[protein]-cysteine S-methyltransferase